MKGPKPPLFMFAVGLGLLAGLYLVRGALMPFFVAMAMAYLLEPLVARLGKRLGRGTSVLVVVLGFLGGLVTLGALVLPWLWGQGARFLARVPAWRMALQQKLAPWLEGHPEVKNRLQGALDGIEPGTLLKGLQSAGTGLLGVFLTAMTLVLVPLILYYLLLEGPRITAWVDGLIPPRHRSRVRDVVADIHHRMGGYIRGQLAVAAAMSVLQGFGFTLMGVPYGWLLGLVAGISNVVPYSPYITGLPAGLVLAGLEGAGAGRLMAIVAVFILVQKAEAFYFTPVWVGRATRLHPLEVLLAVLAFGSVFGLLGLMMAVPLMIVVKVVCARLLADYHGHPWFGAESTGSGEPPAVAH